MKKKNMNKVRVTIVILILIMLISAGLFIMKIYTPVSVCLDSNNYYIRGDKCCFQDASSIYVNNHGRCHNMSESSWKHYQKIKDNYNQARE